jgi:deoxyribodipyrimidine photo-lyase
MPNPPPVVIHWFRRDLRVADNPGLWGAGRERAPVVPLYIRSEWRGSHPWTGPNRQSFLCGSLASLAANLETIGGRLIVRKGDAVRAFAKIFKERPVLAVHCNADPDPFGQSVEAALRSLCERSGVKFHVHHDVSLHPADQVLSQTGTPYRVYTPYSRTWLALEKPRPLGKPAGLDTPADIASLPLPVLADWHLPPPADGVHAPGERAARQRLKAFLNGKIQRYAALRDVPAAAATSRLSQDLRHGLVSIRSVFAAAMKAREAADAAGRANIDVFIKELAWREFYFAILRHFPHVLEHEFNADWRGLPWDEPGDRFEAWKTGHTGFPLVDAGMRELLATGFMHNRLRMITAMFLTKDLHHDWRLGEAFFMQQLTDGEIASNNGGWQWSAGTGADAAPYFRIQNPWTQSSRHDPDGTYIKRWLPELRDVPPERLAAPPRDGQPLAKGYPLPIIDHKAERERTLRIFGKHREATR